MKREARTRRPGGRTVPQSSKYLIPGMLLSTAFVAAIAATAPRLNSFQIVGRTVPFAYPWRLTVPTTAARITSWAGYGLHNLAVWAIIYLAQRQKPRVRNELRWFNIALIWTTLVAAVLHLVQSQLFYDGLAADVPEVTALGSVAFMLIIVLIIETPRRGLIFGKRLKFKDGFVRIARKYHGYLFAWATIYTFWYHPTEGTWGHLLGFFYMAMLFVQTSLIYTRTHTNRIWTFALEVFVLFHGVVVAIAQGVGLWPMFAFGFGAMVILTQMYGLGFGTRIRWALAGLYVATAVAFYALSGNLVGLNEILRIPIIDYATVLLLYGLYLLVRWGAGLSRRSVEAGAGGD